MKLIEYIPHFLQDIREFKQIFNVEDEEIIKLNNQIEKILKEAVVGTAQDYGLNRYEKIYNIKNNANDIPTRRYTILSKINNKLPYSLKWLENKLNNTIGKDNYEITVDYNNYSIRIEILALYRDLANLLNRDLREQLPANLQITVNLFQTEQSKSYFVGFVHTGDFITIRQVI